MNAAVITVFQTEFHDKEGLIEEFRRLCYEEKKIGDAHVFAPMAGELVPFVRLLQHYGITYGIHFPRHFASKPDLNVSSSLAEP